MIKKTIIGIFSIGWVFPLFISLYLIMSFLKNEVYPVIYKSEGILNSFPYLHTAEKLLNVALAWFIVVLISGVVYFLRKKNL